MLNVPLIPKKYQRFQWFVFCGLSVLFLLLLIAFFVIPSVFEIKAKKEQTDELLTKNQALREKIQNLESLTVSDLEEKYKLANVGLLSTKNPYYVLAIFDSLLNRIDAKNIDLGAIAYAPGEIKEKTGKTGDDLVFTQTVKGKIDKVNEFVALVEKSFPIMSIRSVEGEYGESVMLAMNFVLHIYPEVSQIPSIETPVSLFSPNEQKLFDEISPYAGIYNTGSASASLKKDSVQKSGKTNPFEE